MLLLLALSLLATGSFAQFFGETQTVYLYGTCGQEVKNVYYPGYQYGDSKRWEFIAEPDMVIGSI